MEKFMGAGRKNPWGLIRSPPCLITGLGLCIARLQIIGGVVNSQFTQINNALIWS